VPQLPALLTAAQRLPRLRRLTLRCCDGQSFGWRATRLAALGQGLGLEILAGMQLRALEHLEVGRLCGWRWQGVNRERGEAVTASSANPGREVAGRERL
jgi:hypothetical protein